MTGKVSEDHGHQRNYKFLQMSHVFKISIDDPVKVVELLSYALPILRESVTRLQVSLEERDITTFRRQLHKLKGSLGVIEPARLYHHAAELEDLLREREDFTPGKRADNFIKEVEELMVEMETELTNFKR